MERAGHADDVAREVPQARRPESRREQIEPGVADLRVALASQVEVAVDRSVRGDPRTERAHREGVSAAEPVEQGHR